MNGLEVNQNDWSLHAIGFEFSLSEFKVDNEFIPMEDFVNVPLALKLLRV